MRMNQTYQNRSFQREREFVRDMRILQFEDALERQRSLTRNLSKSPIPKDTHHTKRTPTQQTIFSIKTQVHKNPYMAGLELRRQPRTYKPEQKDEYYDSKGSKQLQYLQSQEYCHYLESFLNPPQRGEDIVQKIRQTRNNNVYLEKYKQKEKSHYLRQQPKNSKAKPIQQRQKKDYSYLAHSLQNMSKITDDEFILINDPSSNNLLSREAYLEDNQQLDHRNKLKISRNPSGSIQLVRHDEESRHENTIQLPSKIYYQNRRDSGEFGYLDKENAKTITKTVKNFAHLYERSSPLTTFTKANIKQTTPSKLKQTPNCKKIQWTPIGQMEKCKFKKQNIQNKVRHSPLHMQFSDISNKNDKTKQLTKQAQTSTKRMKTPQKCYKVYEQSSAQKEQPQKFNRQVQHKQSIQSLQSNIYCIDFKLTRPGKIASSFIRASSTADLSDNVSNHSRSHSRTKMSVVSISGKRNK